MSIGTTRTSPIFLHIAGVIVCLACHTALAGPLEPPGPPGDPTMIPIDEVDPRIPIYAERLPLNITEPGSYYLAENISTTGGGIIVQSHDVTIDLMGFTLEGGTGPGIDGSTHDRITVRNGTIRGWSGTGIWLRAKAVLSDLFVAGNQGSGINVGYNSRIVGCTAVGNSVHGIIAGDLSIVEGCVAEANGENGIWALGLVSGCVVEGNGKNGIRVDYSSAVLNNYVAINDSGGFNGKAGIWVNGNYNRIEGNTLDQNGIGIDLDGNYNTIARNVVGCSLTANFDVNPSATSNLMPIFTVGSPGTPGPWDNIEQP